MEQTAALELLKSRVVKACAAHALAHSKDKDYRAGIFIDTCYFVKFGHPD